MSETGLNFRSDVAPALVDLGEFRHTVDAKPNGKLHTIFFGTSRVMAKTVSDQSGETIWGEIVRHAPNTFGQEVGQVSGRSAFHELETCRRLGRWVRCVLKNIDALRSIKFSLTTKRADYFVQHPTWSALKLKAEEWGMNLVRVDAHTFELRLI